MAAWGDGDRGCDVQGPGSRGDSQTRLGRGGLSHVISGRSCQAPNAWGTQGYLSDWRLITSPVPGGCPGHWSWVGGGKKGMDVRGRPPPVHGAPAVVTQPWALGTVPSFNLPHLSHGDSVSPEPHRRGEPPGEGEAVPPVPWSSEAPGDPALGCPLQREGAGVCHTPRAQAEPGPELSVRRTVSRLCVFSLREQLALRGQVSCLKSRCPASEKASLVQRCLLTHDAVPPHCQ